MTFSYLGPNRDPAFPGPEGLGGWTPPHEVELRNVDVKEEPGRRGSGGAVLPGERENEKAAEYLTGELACLANTPGGGALILGVADDGKRIGTSLDAEWLRRRIFKLSDRRLTPEVREGDLDGTRLLVLVVPEAVAEPVRWKRRIYQRVERQSVEVDPNSWHSGQFQRRGYDWSAQSSGYGLEEARPAALEAARRFLRQAVDDRNALELAAATDADLLRRLNVVDGQGALTNAGSLLFVDTPGSPIDYQRRDHPGGDSLIRILRDGPLLTQLAEVELAAAAANRTVHLQRGLVESQVRVLPASAIREAVVNGVVHRDWASSAPTLVEHVGDTLIVTSPGGFVGGVSPSNIITHPSSPRYRSLAEVFKALRIAEREGIGVDRMVADLLALGHSAPTIEEIPGPYVRAVLLGGPPDPRWTTMLDACQPLTIRRDVDLLLLIDHLLEKGWVDAEQAAPRLQRNTAEAAAALGRLRDVRLDGQPMTSEVEGVPDDQAPAWHLSRQAGDRLSWRRSRILTSSGRRGLILNWARQRGRVSTTEVADLAGVSQPTAWKLLSSLAEEGLLISSRANGAGRGFFYRPAE
jgi:ATP-dependent DNA helicase RecG